MKVPVTTEVHSRIHFVTVPVFPEDVCFLIMNWLICKCILAACWCLSTISNRRKGLIIITQLSWQRLFIPQGVFALLPLSWIQSAVDTALGKRQSDPLSMSCVNPTIALHKKKQHVHPVQILNLADLWTHYHPNRGWSRWFMSSFFVVWLGFTTAECFVVWRAFMLSDQTDSNWTDWIFLPVPEATWAHQHAPLHGVLFSEQNIVIVLSWL